MIIKNGKLYHYFDSYKRKEDAIQEAKEYKKNYEKSQWWILPYVEDRMIRTKKFGLYMTKVIKVLR